MPKKFKGENSKVTASKERKAAHQAEVLNKKHAEIERKEREEWSVGAKDTSKKEAQKLKKEAQLKKKNEAAELLEKEEKELSKFKPKLKITGEEKKAIKRTQKNEKITEERREIPEFAASNIDDALDLLSIATSPTSGASTTLNNVSNVGTQIEKHPERRFKAALAVYEEREMPKIRQENPGGSHYGNQRPRITVDYDEMDRPQPVGPSFGDRRNFNSMRRIGASDGGPSSEMEYPHEYDERHIYRRDNRYRTHDDSSRSDPRYPTNSAGYGYNDDRIYSRDPDRYSGRNIYSNDRERPWRRDRRSSRERHYDRDNDRDRLPSRDYPQHRNSNVPPYFDRDNDYGPYRRRPFYREGDPAEVERLRFNAQITPSVRRDHNRSTSPNRSSNASSPPSQPRRQSTSPKMKSSSRNSTEISPCRGGQDRNQGSSIHQSDKNEEVEDSYSLKEQEKGTFRSPVSLNDSIIGLQYGDEVRKRGDNENGNEKGGWSGWHSIDQGDSEITEGNVQPSHLSQGETGEAAVTEFDDKIGTKSALVEAEISSLKSEEKELPLEKSDEQKSMEKSLIDSCTTENSKRINEESVNSNDVSLNDIPSDSTTIYTNSRSQRTEPINELGREIEQIEEDLDHWNNIYNKKKESIAKKMLKERMERETRKEEKENRRKEREKRKEERLKRGADERALRINKEGNENRKRTSDQTQKKNELSGRKVAKRVNTDNKLSKESAFCENDVNDNYVAESSVPSNQRACNPSEEEIKKIYNDLWAGIGVSYNRPIFMLNYSLKRDTENKKIEKLQKERENLKKKWLENQKTSNSEEKVKKDRYNRNPNSRKSGRLSKNEHVNSERFSKNDYVNSEAAVEEIAKQIEKLHEQQCRAARIPPMIIGEKNRNYAKFIDNNHLVNDPVVFYGFNRDLGKEWTAEEHSIFMKYFKFTPKRFDEIAKHLEEKKKSDCHNYYYYLKSKKPEIYKELKKASSSNKGGGKSKEDYSGKIGKVNSSVNRNILAATSQTKSTTRKTRSKSIVAETGQLKTDEINTFLSGHHQPFGESSHEKAATSAAPSADARQNEEDILEAQNEKDLSCANRAVKTEAEEFGTSPQPDSSQVFVEPSLIEVKMSESSSTQAFQESIPSITNDVDEAAHALTLLSRQHLSDEPHSILQKPAIKGKNKAKQHDPTTRIERPSRSSTHSIDDPNIPKKKGTSSYWNKVDVEKFNSALTQYGTNFKKISEILETKSEIQVKNYYEKQISSGAIQKAVESRTESQMHVDASSVKISQPVVKPHVQSPDLNLGSPNFIHKNPTELYNGNLLNDKPVPFDPPKPPTRSSSSISHLLNPPTDESVSNSHDNWFSDSNSGDQPADNPMVIDLVTDDEPETTLSESKTSGIISPVANPHQSSIQFGPANHAPRVIQRQQIPQQQMQLDIQRQMDPYYAPMQQPPISNTQNHQQQQNMPRTNIHTQLHPTQNWVGPNTQQAQINNFLIPPVNRQSGSLQPVPQQRLCYPANPQQPSHQGQHVIPQPQKTPPPMLYPTNPPIYSAVQHDYSPPRFGLIVSADSSTNVTSQKAGGSNHQPSSHGDANSVKAMPQISQYPQHRNLASMETSRSYPVMQNPSTSFHMRPFESYNNASAIVAPTTSPDSVQARQSSYRVRPSDQHQVDHKQNSGPPA
ncbi:6027_t:CDS:2 [Acaulospora morrowiae]|uniref:6027_t:CDS:1 n=1 Tax=Acaulospora morrowiae TaxID=94023 RepID=A0A9N8VL11_9GLOM|nr:6027_t:CDS:2 [Acaulospora morrowiae]